MSRDYWRVTSLYNGNYARAMIKTRRRFEALMCFLKVVNPNEEDQNDRLRKVRFLHDHIKERCNSLFRPGKCISVDERMIKCKGRAPFTQYLPKKPVKWGFKVFALCDAATSMLVNFEVYTGQESSGEKGLTHAVVMRLVAGLENRGHVLYTDNFYSSASLALSLQGIQMSLVGTIRANRRSFPVAMKADLKQFERYAERGTCRYIRDGNVLYLQWKDKRTVSMLSTIHLGHEHNLVQRNAKIAGQYQQLELQQPKCIADYNRSMGGVDVFDQVVATHRVLRKMKYWKSLFLDFLDVSAVNAYFLFEIWRKKHPDSIK